MKTSSSVPLILSYSLYIGLAIAFAFRVPESYQYFLGTCALLTSVWLMSASLVKALYLVILVTHIGPILQSTIPSVGIFTLGDAYLLLLLAFFLLKVARHGLKHPPFGFALFALPVLALVSSLTVDIVAALPGLINMGQIGLVYFLVMNEVGTREEAAKLIQGIGVGVLVSASLHLVYYARGESLALSGQDPGQTALLLGELTGEYVKTAFFYISFHASSAVAIILGIRHLLMPDETRLGTRLFWVVVVILAVSSSLISGSRTTLLSSALVSIPIFFSHFRQSNKRRALLEGVLLLLLVLVPIIVYDKIVQSDQKEVFLEMFVSNSAISADERMQMWFEISEKIISSPIAFLFGVGPDVPVRAPDEAVIQQLMFIPSLQFQPTSFHNFYIDVLFQQGVFFLAIALMIAFKTIRKLYSHVKLADRLAADCLFSILVWLLVWITHATGWSKPLIILSVLFSVSHLLVFGRLRPTQSVKVNWRLPRRRFVGSLAELARRRY